MAFITKRTNLEYAQMIYGDDEIFISSKISESAIFVDLISIPYSKSFKHFKVFNNL